MRKRAEQERMLREQYLIRQEELKKEREKALEVERAQKKQIDERCFDNSYNEIKNKFTQQDFQIRDSLGRRWVQCERCGEIKLLPEFASYGGTKRINLGVCYKCTGRGKR